MTNATSNTSRQVRFAGIQPESVDGIATKIAAEPTFGANTEGDARFGVENYNPETGSFDVVLKPGAENIVSRATLNVNPDLDGSGDPAITEEFVYTVTAVEAGRLGNLGAGVEEPVTP